MCITEHWLKQHELLLNICNYRIASSFTRKSAIHGGSMIIVKDDYKSKELKNVVQLSIERVIEISCVELENHIILCVYRPPSSDFCQFEPVMEDALKQVFASSKSVIVCGDFNVNLLDSANRYSGRLLNLFKSFNLFHLFEEPTRVTANTATCLDNIFCKCDAMDKEIINCFNSDHSGQKACFTILKQTNDRVITYRPVTEARVEKFKENIINSVPEPYMEGSDPNVLYKNLSTVINREFEKVFTLRTKMRNGNKAKFSDWATVGIHKSRTRLYELYEMKSHSQDPSFIDYVRKYSKLFKKVCIAAKADYLSNKVKSAENKVKAVWNVINSETGKSKPRNCQFQLKVDDRILTSDLEVAGAFENFFSDIAVNTTRDLKSSTVLASSYLNEIAKDKRLNFDFQHTNSEEIIKTFKSLKLKNTEDLWGISVRVMQSVIHIVAPYLAVIFNKCIDDGVFPDLMKYSKVIPLFKAGSSSDPGNFRPISVLPVLSKVFEKIMLNQLLRHFNVNNLLHSQQFGFTKGRSTTDAAASLMKYIYDAWENSQDAIGIFCDLSKAFDCVEHETLIRKLQHYGLSAKALNLVKSYLSQRIQKVDINRTQSAGSAVKLGVPQGSILGPFLFLVYINDLPHLLEQKCNIVLFADDTSLIFKVNRQQENPTHINETLAEALNWFTANNLLLNAAKTKCIKFSLPNVRQFETIISLNGENLKLVHETVFLGLTLDRNLQWSPHISGLAGRLSSAAYAVRRIRQFTNVETARLVYFSYFHSIMSYGMLIWGKAADIETIFILQKRAVRSIYNLGSRDSLRERFKEINILTVSSQYIHDCIHTRISSPLKKCQTYMISILVISTSLPFQNSVYGK
ncbi:uncharacterized protein [Choristoneura fumiferana]|uniref:uncharacterized protein n=1 Tax=Choristoneura fumiferana TaxID=7141 RepID=UPI003D15726F